MTTHFPTVPVDGALRAANASSSDRLRPVALIADDDPMITSTLCAVLNVSGLAAMAAHNGLSALEVGRVIPPQILIADLVLPGLSGMELAAQITKATSDCEVILFADSASAAGLSATMLGSRRFNFRLLFKPIHPVDLLQAVLALLGPRGHALTIRRDGRHLSSYDLLTVVRPEPEAIPLGLNVTRRRQHPGESH